MRHTACTNFSNSEKISFTIKLDFFFFFLFAVFNSCSYFHFLWTVEETNSIKRDKSSKQQLTHVGLCESSSPSLLLLGLFYVEFHAMPLDRQTYTDRLHEGRLQVRFVQSF